MGDDDVKYLPVAPSDEQTKTDVYSHFQQGPFEDEDGTRELRAREGDTELFMQFSDSTDSEYVTAGVHSYSAWRKLTESDLEEGSWITSTDHDSAREVASPTYDEMDELSARYEQRLENAVTDEDEREVLEEMWDEAAEMELEGRESFG